MTDNFNDNFNDALDNTVVKEIENEWRRSPWERLAKVAFVSLGTLLANVALEKTWNRKFRSDQTDPAKDAIDVEVVE